MFFLSILLVFRRRLAIACLLSGLLVLVAHQLFSNLHSQLVTATNLPVPLVSILSVDSVSVSEIAKQTTVRIFTNPGAGSGVIIKRRGQTYTVLTCEHVVAESNNNRYSVMTTDGVMHQAKWLRSVQFGDADIALVQFTTPQSYRAVGIGNSNALSRGDRVYAAGFPNWQWLNSNAIDDTYDLGIRAFKLTTGKVGLLSEKSLSRGYQLGYTNDIENGMSGGPVLDNNGRLIGINGRLKYPLQGIRAFTFADGTVPSETVFQQMKALSWAIPTATFKSKVS